MTRYWLTVHWPLCDDERTNVFWRNWIFIEKGQKRYGQKIRIDDRVFIYETGSSPVTIKENHPVNRRIGRKGIVALATITTNLYYDDDEPEIIVGRRPYYWNYKAETHTDEECHDRECLSLDDLRILLQRPNFCAYIPGGLMELNESQFNRIHNRFTQIV